jgi:uncharacterized protein YqeY
MELYNKIKKNMIVATKEKDAEIKDLLKVLISDIQRDPNKDYNDDKVISIIKKTVKSLYDNYDLLDEDKYLIQAEYLERVYLPKQISSDEIIEALNKIDFDNLKNKMQAVGIVMKQFPKGSIDGKTVKEIINNQF